MVTGRLGESSDLRDQPQARGEVTRAEDGEGNRPQDSPVVDAVGVMELSGRDCLSHGLTVGAGRTIALRILSRASGTAWWRLADEGLPGTRVEQHGLVGMNDLPHPVDAAVHQR